MTCGLKPAQAQFFPQNTKLLVIADAPPNVTVGKPVASLTVSFHGAAKAVSQKKRTPTNKDKTTTIVEAKERGIFLPFRRLTESPKSLPKT